MQLLPQVAFLFFWGVLLFVYPPIPDSTAQNYPMKPIRIIVGFATGGLTDSNDIISRLNAEIGSAVNTLRMKEVLSRQGHEAETATAEQFAFLMRNAIAKNTRLVRLIGLEVE